MFNISIQLDESDSRVFFQCPKCATKSVYFIVSPYECENCGEPLPDPSKMENSERARYNYHVYNKS